VLCAESDVERDSWVEALVRYVSGSVDDGSETVFGTSSAGSSTLNVGQYQGTRSSTSSSVMSPTEAPPPQRAARRGISKDDITKISIPNAPIPSDRSTSSAITSPEMGSGSDMWTSSATISDGGQVARQAPGSSHVALSSSVPTNMDAASQSGTLPRASSELGHYQDMTADNRSDARASTSSAGAYRPHRASYHPSLSTVKAGAGSTDSSSGPDAVPTQGANTKVKMISGPINGTPIPAGYKFGVKDTTPSDSGSERERKAKSGRFWGFGKHGAPGGHPTVTRVVFGVPISDALAVAQIANLPAIVFRCIEYLEKKKADQEEGIYRLSGSSAVMKALKDRFNTGLFILLGGLYAHL
jgi:RalA-binding protein 1